MRFALRWVDMKTAVLTVLLAFAGAAPVVGADNWVLVWSDDFNYRGLPDPTKWDYEVGFVRNHEQQYYTRARLENARVENGVLIIECRKEEFKLSKGGPAHYTSASLFTRDPAGWLYGRIEVRAKLPSGRGVWPAIWTLGVDFPKVAWPYCGEIDILEYVGKVPNSVHAAVHYQVNGKHKMDARDRPTESPYDDFHTYAIEWYPDRIDFFFDGEKHHTFAVDKAGTGADNPFRKPHRLLIDFALGGSWGGDIDDSALPQQFLIKYVRYYRSAGG